MKLRCTHNSIRIRVRKSDLQRLEAEGGVEESMSFGPSSILSFGIYIDRKSNSVMGSFEKNKVRIDLPIALAQHWIQSQEVGIEVQQELSGGDSLHILLEKDFPCGDREGEDKADTFWELAEEGPEAC